MEFNYLFTRSMLNIMQPLIEHIELFTTYSNEPNADSISKLEVEDICYPLLQLKDPIFKHEVLSLKVALRDFYNNIDLMKLKNENSQRNVEIFNNVLHCAYNVLEAKDRLAARSVCTLIDKCEAQFKKLMNASCEEELSNCLQNFTDTSQLCLEQVRARAEELMNVKQKQLILLCINQISKSASLLISVFQLADLPDENKLLSKYVSERINWCFKELKTAIENSKSNFKDEKECGGQFVHKMDIALHVLSSHKEELFDTDLKSAVDEVLCHAMSIAHVAIDSDFTRITHSCEKVLKALQELRRNYSSEENPSMKELYVGHLTDALEVLEQQVNTALLKLVLEVFCDLYSPLKKLLLVCQVNGPPEKRNNRDLEDMISVFDLQMDRIMQIGLFAMACSDDTKRVVGIQSCLASLESLEPELIPALLAHYQEPSSISNLVYLKELVSHWKNEASELKELIHNIVDPAAFCEVTVGDVHIAVATLKSRIQDDNINFLKQKISSILKKANILAQQLKVSLRDDCMNNVPSELQKYTKDFYFSCSELETAFHLYLKDGSENVSLGSKKRLLKRCELVVSSMKRVQPLVLQCMSRSGKEVHNADSKNNLFKYGSTLWFPDSVKDLPVDADASVSDMKDSTGCKVVKSMFENLMKQGKALTKERSILYHTPKRNKDLSARLKPPQMPKLDAKRTCDQPDLLADQSLGLDITNILDKLTFLSDTLTSKRNKTDYNQELLVCDLVHLFSRCSENNLQELGSQEGKLNYSCLSKSLLSSRSTLNAPSSSHEVDTPQRIDDLCAVKKKIAALKASTS